MLSYSHELPSPNSLKTPNVFLSKNGKEWNHDGKWSVGIRMLIITMKDVD
jgi:hypothetical protein